MLFSVAVVQFSCTFFSFFSAVNLVKLTGVTTTESKTASAKYDAATDAAKLLNSGLNIYSLSTDKQKLAASVAASYFALYKLPIFKLKLSYSSPFLMAFISI